MVPDLAGRRALVTGAASGIGLAVARTLSAAGATVCLSDRPGDALDVAAVEIPGSTAHAADLSDRSQIESQAAAHGIEPAAALNDVLLAPNAVKRLIEPADVAAMVPVVCGPAAWAMTGSALAMDAGWLAH